MVCTTGSPQTATNAAHQDGKWPRGGEEMLDWRLRHDTSVASWLLDAIPYFLPVHDAVSILDSHPPEPNMLAELRLPFIWPTILPSARTLSAALPAVAGVQMYHWPFG